VAPGLRIIILTMHEDPQLANELIKLGARAYLVKSATRAELVSVIRGVCSDDGRVMVSMSRHGYRQFGQATDLLTRRQTQIINLAAQALSNAQIADRLYISESTVKRHLTKIYAQLGAVSRVDAINKARAAVLIPSIDPDSVGSSEEE
jgi:DNA-binding NarL/FixJ family response regulator